MTQEASKKGDAERVVLDDPEHQNLLGLLMNGLLATNMADDAIYRRVRSLDGDIEVGAGEMAVTLRFAGGVLTVVAGPSKKPKAKVSGDMSALLGIVGGGGLVGPVLSGAIRIGGNPFVLLKLLPLMKVPEEKGSVGSNEKESNDE